MKRLFPVLLLLFFHVANGQRISAKVIDASNDRPLSYAIILFHHQQKITYTDNDGYFSLPKDSLPANDTIIIQYIGYTQTAVTLNGLQNGAVYKLSPETQNLQPITVSNCRKTEEYVLNKTVGRIKQYIGPGPETRLIIMARYNNVTGVRGFINKISILIDEKSPNLQVPVRLHWYKWDAETHMPGEELTDTSILVYPYQKGWNDFDLPPYTVPALKDWIVFGLEFIYTPAYIQHYDSLKTQQEKIQWLSDMQNRWSLSMQYVKDSDESGFYIVNNGTVTPYATKYDRFFIRPALRFTIKICRD
jgi:hypothetical protein